jgi:hypothetical protein
MWSSATDLVASGEDGADDDARERMAKAMVSTTCLHSCWSEDEGWLEREAASGDDGVVAALQKSDNSKLQEMRLREGRGTVQERGRGVTVVHRICHRRSSESAASNGEIRRPCGDSCGEKEGRSERRSRE